MVDNYHQQNISHITNRHQFLRQNMTRLWLRVNLEIIIMWSICVWFKLQTIVPQTSDFYNRTSSGGFTTLDLVTSIGIDHMPPNGMCDVSLIIPPSVSFSWPPLLQSPSYRRGWQLAIWTCVAILSSLWGGPGQVWVGVQVSRQICGVRSHPSGPPYPSLSTCWRASFFLPLVFNSLFFQ